jgi:hypothetical protein
VAGNVGHVAIGTLADRATAGIPPLAAASALAVGLGVLKRVVSAVPEAVPAGVPDGQLYPEALTAFAAELEAGTLPAHRAIRDRLSVGASTAKKIRTYLEDIIRTRALEGATS